MHIATNEYMIATTSLIQILQFNKWHINTKMLFLYKKAAFFPHSLTLTLTHTNIHSKNSEKKNIFSKTNRYNLVPNNQRAAIADTEPANIQCRLELILPKLQFKRLKSLFVFVDLRKSVKKQTK